MRQLRVVAGVVVRPGAVLVARRGPSMSSSGLWECPGGKVERGETDAEALVRELREELHITVVVGEHLMDVVEPRDGWQLRVVFYVCALSSGVPTLTEHDAVRWCEAAELRALNWQAADRPAVEPICRLIAGR